MSVLFNLALALLCGLLMTRLLKKWNLPDVTSFLITGVLLGPFFLGRLGSGNFLFSSYEQVEMYRTVSQVAMGFIAFSIGTEFRLESLKKTGKQAFVIGIFQAITAAVLVDIALLGFSKLFPSVLSVPAAITLGAIATATAPAATMMVVRQYKAKGPLTELLLPIVALDDAVGLVVFAISFGVAKVLISGSISLVSIILDPLVEILFSLLIGTIAGILLTEMERLFHSNTNRLSMTTGFVILVVAVTSVEFEIGPVTVGSSSLLTCMMLGTVFCNICPLSEDLMTRSDKWSAPVLATFFVLSGAELQLEVFAKPILVLVGVIYIVFRCLGKYFGAYFSAKAVGCSDNIVKNLGITLFPQAGVALGMCVTAQQLGGNEAKVIQSIVLFSVLVYELVGPIMTREALTHAGDIKEKPHEVVHRRAIKLANAEDKLGVRIHHQHRERVKYVHGVLIGKARTRAEEAKLRSEQLKKELKQAEEEERAKKQAQEPDYLDDDANE